MADGTTCAAVLARRAHRLFLAFLIVWGTKNDAPRTLLHKLRALSTRTTAHSQWFSACLFMEGKKIVRQSVLNFRSGWRLPSPMYLEAKRGGWSRGMNVKTHLKRALEQSTRVPKSAPATTCAVLHAKPPPPAPPPSAPPPMLRRHSSTGLSDALDTSLSLGEQSDDGMGAEPVISRKRTKPPLPQDLTLKQKMGAKALCATGLARMVAGPLQRVSQWVGTRYAGGGLIAAMRLAAASSRKLGRHAQQAAVCAASKRTGSGSGARAGADHTALRRALRRWPSRAAAG